MRSASTVAPMKTRPMCGNCGDGGSRLFVVMALLISSAVNVQIVFIINHAI